MNGPSRSIHKVRQRQRLYLLCGYGNGKVIHKHECFTLPLALPLLQRMGSEPIYLQHHCRSRSSENESISYNGIQLLTLPLPLLLPHRVNGLRLYMGFVGLNESVQRRLHDFQEGHQLERQGGGMLTHYLAKIY